MPEDLRNPDNIIDPQALNEWFVTRFDPQFPTLGNPSLGAPVIASTPYGVTTPSEEVLSAYDPIEFNCTWAGSDNTTISNIRMKAVLKSGAVPTLTTLGTQTKQSIDVSGTTTYRFNFADMLKTVLSPEYYNNITSDQINSAEELESICVRFQIDFSVLFVDKDGYEREDEVLNSGLYYVSNAILQHDESIRILDTTNDYVLSDSSSKFLTKAPQNKVIYSGEDEQLSFHYVGSTSLDLHYQTYDLDGNANSDNAKTSKLITNKYGTFTISDNGASTIIDDFANISKVDVWIEESTGAQISEKRTFLCKQSCATGYRLWWHNSLGGIDKYTFNNKTNKTYNVSKRTNYRKPLDNTPTTGERARGTMSVQGDSIFTATTSFLAGDLDMFVDLLNSTEVLFQPDVTSATLVPVVIMSTEQAEEDSDGLINMTIEFMPSQSHKTHIG